MLAEAAQLAEILQRDFLDAHQAKVLAEKKAKKAKGAWAKPPHNAEDAFENELQALLWLPACLKNLLTQVMSSPLYCNSRTSVEHPVETNCRISVQTHFLVLPRKMQRVSFICGNMDVMSTKKALPGKTFIRLAKGLSMSFQISRYKRMA